MSKTENKKEEKVEIKKIILDLGDGHEITIPIEKAKKLKAALEELFGKEVIKEIREEHHHHNNVWPYRWYWDYQPYWGSYSKTNAIGKGLLGDARTGINFPDVQFTMGDNLKASFSAENKSLSLSVR